MNSWYRNPRWSDEFEKGLDNYLDEAFATSAQGGQIPCPCGKCCYRQWFREKDFVKDHVILNGFISRLKQPASPGLTPELGTEDMGGESMGEVIYAKDDINGLLNDTRKNDPDDETKIFYKLMEDSKEKSYPGCKNFSKLSFTIRLCIFKCDNKLSNNGFNDLLSLLRAMHLEAKLPSSYNDAKKVLKGLWLSYDKIEACPNDCMLYWEDNAAETHSKVCKSPRWKPDERAEKSGKSRRKPYKVLRHFLVKKMLQRLYMCARTAQDMTWHLDGCVKDNLLRHLADCNSWKDFDLAFPKFAEEPHNVRLGLSTDGFNPFNTMSICQALPQMMMNLKGNNLQPRCSTLTHNQDSTQDDHNKDKEVDEDDV